MFMVNRVNGWMLARKFAVLMSGLFLLAFGNVLCYRAELGLGPWNVLHQGISLRTPLSFGTATIVIGILIVLLGLTVGIRPGVGTVVNMLMVGVFSDFLLATHWFYDLRAGHIVVRLLVTVLGVVMAGVGTALYLAPKWGAGPRDSFMLFVHKVTRQRIAVVRFGIEVFVLLLGIWLGGTFGVGTFLFAFGIGPSVEIGMWLVRKLSQPEVKLAWPMSLK